MSLRRTTGLFDFLFLLRKILSINQYIFDGVNRLFLIVSLVSNYFTSF